MLNQIISFISIHFSEALSSLTLLLTLYILWFVRRSYKATINQFIVMDGNLKLVYKKVNDSEKLHTMNEGQQKQMLAKLNENIGNSINRLHTQIKSLGNVIRNKN